MSDISTKPYMLRAIYEWCTDSGYSPYIAVKVNQFCQVPMAFVKKGEIVLNISFGATKGLKLDNDSVSFSARFGGVARDIYVPVENVLAIYASENGQGMAFEVKLDEPGVGNDAPPSAESESGEVAKPASVAPDDGAPKKSGRPTLTRVK
jgi:stringent starvation protein B